MQLLICNLKYLFLNLPLGSDQIRSVAQSCPTLCHPMNRSTPGLPVHHQLPEFTQNGVHSVHSLTSIESVMPSSHLILCRPLLLLPPIPPSIRVFSNESTLHMRWPKYWSFSFSIIPSKEMVNIKHRCLTLVCLTMHRCLTLVCLTWHTMSPQNICANQMSNRRGKTMQILTGNGEKFAFNPKVDMIQYAF